MSVPRKDIVLNPEKPFSDAVLRGDTLYLSGRLGVVPGTSQVPESVVEEVHNLMEGFRLVLEKAEMTFNDLAYVQIFAPDVSLWGAFNEIYLTYFTGPLPARAFIGSGPLLFGARFEMQGIAIRS
jgi:2-iminobutanoate/2-iminopropanoate deaminase